MWKYKNGGMKNEKIRKKSRQKIKSSNWELPKTGLKEMQIHKEKIVNYRATKYIKYLHVDKKTKEIIVDAKVKK